MLNSIRLQSKPPLLLSAGGGLSTEYEYNIHFIYVTDTQIKAVNKSSITLVLCENICYYMGLAHINLSFCPEINPQTNIAHIEKTVKVAF